MNKFSLQFSIAFLLCFHSSTFKRDVADALHRQLFHKFSEIETKLSVWKSVRNSLRDFQEKVENFNVANIDRNGIPSGLSRESRFFILNDALYRNETGLDFPYIANRWSTDEETRILDEYKFRSRIAQSFLEPGVSGEKDASHLNSSVHQSVKKIAFYHFVGEINDDEVGIDTIFLRDKQIAMWKDEISCLPPFPSENGTAMVDHRSDSSRGVWLLLMMNPLIPDNKTDDVTDDEEQVDSMPDLSGISSNDTTASWENLFDSMDADFKKWNVSLPAPLQKLMRPWLDQSGIPLVKLEVVNQTHISFSQTRFISKQQEDLAQLWNIPVTYITEEMPDEVQVIWLTQKSQILEHDVTKWIFVNPGATGYYRTLYSDHLLQQLSRELDKSFSETKINATSQSQLMDDYMALAREKYVSHATMLEMTTRILAQTEHLAVWKRMLLYNNEILQRFRSHPKYQIVQEYVQYVIGNSHALSKLLTEVKADRSLDIPPSSFVLSNDIRELSCGVGGVQCRLLVSFPFPISTPLREDKFLCEKADREFNNAFEEYIELRKMNVTKEHEKVGHKILRDLGCATRIGNIQNLLNKTLHPEELIYQPGEVAYSKTFIEIYNSLASNPVANGQILPFLEANFNETRNVLGEWHEESMRSVVRTLSTNFCTSSQLIELELSLERVGIADLDSLKKVRKNISWMDTHGNEILSFISNKSLWKSIL